MTKKTFEEFEPEYLLSMKNFRCSICNCVSNESIETNLGDYKPKTSFTADPKDPHHFICVPCSEAIQEVRDDYAYYDFDN